MDSNSLNKQIGIATKWSIATEIAAKLVSPISNMILARFLSPEAFGVVATVTMVTSFADMFTDAGFQKYLVQHEFKNRDDKYDSTTVAFWTNFGISIFLWLLIIINRNNLARLVGNPKLGFVIAVACFSLPLTSFSSIQMALFKRDFAFKVLFEVRIVAISIPLIVTVPLAFLTHSYWALIIGTITVNVANAVILTIKSAWKPRLYYSVEKFKEMFSFSFWTLVEQIAIWLTSYIDTFIVGTLLSTYYMGIYKTSTTTVNQIMALITSATTPVLFSALSRVQTSEAEFKKIFFRFQRVVGIFVIPLGIGIYLYRNLITDILLGKQWTEAAGFVGLWGLMSSITIIFSHFCSEAYRAKGRPKISLIIQISHLIFLAPAVYISCQLGYEILYRTRALIRIELIVANMIMMFFIFRITPIMQIKNIIPEIMSTSVMVVCALLMREIADGYVWQFFSIFLCILVYFLTLLLLPYHRKEILDLITPYFRELRSFYKSRKE